MEQCTTTSPGNKRAPGELPSNHPTSSEQLSQHGTDIYSELDPFKLYTSEGESHCNIHYLSCPQVLVNRIRSTQGILSNLHQAPVQCPAEYGDHVSRDRGRAVSSSSSPVLLTGLGSSLKVSLNRAVLSVPHSAG